MNECALITFLENYSEDNFDKNYNIKDSFLYKIVPTKFSYLVTGNYDDKPSINTTSSTLLLTSLE